MGDEPAESWAKPPGAAGFGVKPASVLVPRRSSRSVWLDLGRWCLDDQPVADPRPFAFQAWHDARYPARCKCLTVQPSAGGGCWSLLLLSPLLSARAVTMPVARPACGRASFGDEGCGTRGSWSSIQAL